MKNIATFMIGFVQPSLIIDVTGPSLIDWGTLTEGAMLTAVSVISGILVAVLTSIIRKKFKL